MNISNNIQEYQIFHKQRNLINDNCHHFLQNLSAEMLLAGTTEAKIRSPWLRHTDNNLYSALTLQILPSERSRDSSVGIAAGYGLDRLGSISGMARCFSSPQSPDRL
jgi:hypothetical protein